MFTPRELPLTWVDHFFGFHEWTVWIYMSDYVLIFFPILFITDIYVLKRIIKAFTIDFLIHFPIFFFWPTIIGRHPIQGNGLTAMAFQFERWMDTAVNCFPSQHVSLCFIVAMGFWNYKRRLSIGLFIWSILISISTMTTKQHYFWDVLGGLLVFYIVYFFSFRQKQAPHITLVSPNK